MNFGKDICTYSESLKHIFQSFIGLVESFCDFAISIHNDRDRFNPDFDVFLQESSTKPGNGTVNGSGIAASASATKLSDVFPSLLTAEDRKPSPPPAVGKPN